MSLLGFLKRKKEEDLLVPPQPLPLRNDHCWCGSGVKYKKCHEARDQEALKRIRQKRQAAEARRSMFN